MRRDFIIILMFIAILALVFVLRPLASAWHHTLSAPAGELLYAAGFDGFTDEWEQAQGRNSAEFTDGAMLLEVGEVHDGVFAPALPYLTDFDARVQATALSGPLDNAFGMVFRLQDPDNYYVFLISSDGYYSVERKVNGIQSVISTWIAQDAIRQDMGVTNTLRVIGVGDTFRFSVNDVPLQLCIPDSGESTYRLGECIGGQMMDHLTDDTLAAGRVGVTAVTLSTPNVAVSFDNLVVYAADSFENE